MTELESLCADLVSGDDARAEQAAQQLPRFGKDGLNCLDSLFSSVDADGRWWVIRALAGFEGDDRITIILLAAIEDKSDDVRQAAAMGFCHLPDPKSMPSLALALEDADPMTAKLVSNAFIVLKKQATPTLLDVLKSGSPNAKVEAARALAEIKDTSSIPGLAKAYEDGSALVQYWAALGLENMGVGMVYLKPE